MRLPLEPLEHAVGAQWIAVRAGGGYLVPERPTCRIAELAGVSRRTVARWRTRGLELYTADRCAVALGLHPSHVWGRLWWVAVAFADLHELEVPA